MIAVFQNALIEYLKTAGFNTKDYFGEFARPSEAKLLKTFLPGIMVDFVDSKPDGLQRENVTFSLYIVHATYSKQENLRTQTDLTLLDYIWSIRKLIIRKSIGGSDPIEITRIKKIYDDAKDSAYLTVYQMVITATLNDPTPLDEEIE
ncbi:hypothetical protein [Sulfuricurvum sp.]|uniref:hypothetical protein n=1 Tax=Sulfuricurvum sp. TaxID=2025608 RepID=UPI0026297F04|nr:hypothetical protein [Sulfuricurvum sp.]MDD2267021.1 hypothetical protein [Sulfuricurvum sp.]MDD2782637.1 hypothetical protein [Sulfuricurvum sp.]